MSERENRRKRLLQFDGTPRSVLEARVTRLVAVLDAAEAFADALDSEGEPASSNPETQRAWDALLAALRDA